MLCAMYLVNIYHFNVVIARLVAQNIAHSVTFSWQMHAEFVKVSLPIHGTVYKVHCTTCLKTLGHLFSWPGTCCDDTVQSLWHCAKVKMQQWQLTVKLTCAFYRHWCYLFCNFVSHCPVCFTQTHTMQTCCVQCTLDPFLHKQLHVTENWTITIYFIRSQFVNRKGAQK